MGSPARVFGGYLGRRLAWRAWLSGPWWRRRRCALVDGGAVLRGEVAVELAGVFAGDGGHLGGEQAGDDTVLVSGPDLAVSAEEGGAGGLSSPTKPSEPSIRPSTNHLKPTGTSSIGRSRPLATRSIMLEDTSVLPNAARLASDQPGRWVKRYCDRDGEVMVGVEQAGGAGDDAVAVGVGIVGPGDVKTCPCWRSCRGHGDRARSSPCGSLPSQSQVMKRKAGSTFGLRRVDREVVLVDDAGQ